MGIGSIEQVLLKAKSFEKKGEIEEARKLYSTTLKLYPKNTRVKKALNKLSTQKKCSNGINSSNLEINNLLALYKNGQYDDAEKIAISLTKEFPKNQFAWKVLGAVFKQTERIDESLFAMQKSVHLGPQDSEAHYNLGTILQELGKLEGAEVSFKKAITLKSDYAEAYNNLGNTLKEMRRFEEAEASFKKALRLKPDYPEAYSNLGNTLREQGRLGEAEAGFKKAIMLKPDLAEAYSNLGNTLKEMNRLDEAESSFKQSITLQPNYAEAHYNLGITLQELDRLDEAESSFKKAITLQPNYPSAKHMLASLTGETSTTAPQDYVEELFDNYAAKFDNSLIKNLGYNIPSVITEIILKDSKFELLGSITDLGCGTGLFGAKIRDMCEYLEGVDLSGIMLKEAKKKNVYNKLIKQDIISYLSNTSLNFDYFVSTDVFIYIGDLSDVFRLIRSRNKKNGKLAFSTEDYDGDGFFLEKSGRYSHSKKYIEGLCEKFSYKLCHFETQPLRKEKNKYISGGLYLLDF